MALYNYSLHINSGFISPVLASSRTEKDRGTVLINSSTSGLVNATFPSSSGTLSTLENEEVISNKTFENVRSINEWKLNYTGENLTSLSSGDHKIYLFTQNGIASTEPISQTMIECIFFASSPEGIAGGSWTYYSKIKTSWKNRTTGDGGHVKIGSDQLEIKTTGTSPISTPEIILDEEDTQSFQFKITSSTLCEYKINIKIFFIIYSDDEVIID